MKQTAVEWLYEIIHKQNYIYEDMSEYLKQAKEMEKEQIIYAYHNGCADQISVPKRGYKPEQYYNEKFKK
jgi:hypothetical protein